MIIIRLLFIAFSLTFSRVAFDLHLNPDDHDLGHDDDDHHLLPGAPPLCKINSAEPAFPDQLDQVVFLLNVHLQANHDLGGDDACHQTA